MRDLAATVALALGVAVVALGAAFLLGWLLVNAFVNPANYDPPPRAVPMTTGDHP